MQSIPNRVQTLLRHYWTPVESDNAKATRMRDWVEDLGEFGAECVDRACSEWRRANPDKRPTPGHIRELCLAERERNATRGTSRSRRGKLIFVDNPAEAALAQQKQAVYAAAEVARDNFAKQRGFENYRDYVRSKDEGGGPRLARPIELPPRILARPAPTYGLAEEPPF